jgi:hypothetical protein
MRFARLGPVGQEIPTVEVDGTSYDLRSLTSDIDGAFLSSDGVMRAPEMPSHRAVCRSWPMLDRCGSAHPSSHRARSSASGSTTVTTRRRRTRTSLQSLSSS